MSADTSTQLLDAAQQLVQERGFNAFSYRDLEQAVGIRTASIHYHYPSKAALGEAMMSRYQGELEAALAAIDARNEGSKAKLERFIAMHRATEKRGAICLCGSLASDLGTLPDSLSAAVKLYLTRCETWVRAQIKAGVASGEFTPEGKAAELAASLVAGLQGGLILSRGHGGKPSVLTSVQRTFFLSLKGA